MVTITINGKDVQVQEGTTILQAAKKLKMSRKQLVRFMSALKLTDDGKKATIHNLKKDHVDVCKALGIVLDPSRKCLG